MTQLRTRDDGFSLLEALIAASLTAMLAVLLFGGVQLGVRVMDRSAARGDAAAQIAIAGNFLRAHLARAAMTSSAGGEAPAFAGDAVGLTFVEMATEAPGYAGPARLRLRGERHHGRLHLAVVWQPLAGDVAEAHRSVLLENLASLEFAYFGATGGGAAAWSPTWQVREALPSLVRVRFRLRDGQAPFETVVALHLAGPPPQRREGAG